LGTPVATIRTREGKVQGVCLKDGTRVDSGSVISNADYKTTFLKLMRQEDVPEGWYRAVSVAKQTGSVFQVCLGIDANSADLSQFGHAHRIIYRRSTDALPHKQQLDWDIWNIDPEDLAGQELEVSLLSRNDEALAPKGGAVIVIRTEAGHAHFERFRSAHVKRTPEYMQYKTRLANALVNEVSCLIPGLDKAVKVMDVATPLTFEDQGGRSGGAVAGWSWNFEDLRDYLPRELVRTPVKGLYMAGYQAFSSLFMGGVPTAMQSGTCAASAVLKGAGPIEHISLPGVA